MTKRDFSPAKIFDLEELHNNFSNVRILNRIESWNSSGASIPVSKNFPYFDDTSGEK